MLKHLSALALLPALIVGQDTPTNGNRNMTVAFFSHSDSALCDSADISNALVLTTSTVPASFTCFNTADIFSQSNTTGSQNGSAPIRNPEVLENPNRIDWLIRNLDKYDPNANYSRVWYEQNSAVGKVEEGQEARWAFYVYAFDNCEQVGGDAFEVKDYPWFETSCQTKEGGQCRTVPNTIKSFAFNSAEMYNEGREKCEMWRQPSAATRIEGRAMGLFSAALCAIVCLLI